MSRSSKRNRTSRNGYGRISKIISVFMALSMMLTLIPSNAIPVYAAQGDTPEHSKTSADNGDGTYKLSLSVTGDAETETATAASVNVIIVYDRSSSMTSNRVNGGSTGPRRADAAEQVVYDFVHNLFRYKAGANATNIQMALVTFAVAGEQAVDWTTNEADIVGTVNVGNWFSRTGQTNSAGQDYSTNSNGTNWEHALYQALDYLGDADGDPTFVVLITDGAPSASGTDGDGDNPGYPPSMNYNQFYARYSAATANALHIQNYDTTTHTYTNADNSNTTLYGIYAYGNEADLLDDLMYYSLNGADRQGMSGSSTSTDN